MNFRPGCVDIGRIKPSRTLTWIRSINLICLTRRAFQQTVSAGPTLDQCWPGIGPVLNVCWMCTWYDAGELLWVDDGSDKEEDDDHEEEDSGR